MILAMFGAASRSTGLLIALAGCDLVFGLPPPEAVDAGLVDTTVDGLDELQIVARYRFETVGPKIVDDIGGHDGVAVAGVMSSEGQVGKALAFPATLPHPHVVVADSDDWDLTTGAIELWVRAAPATDQLGILSRDSFGTEDGHFTLIQHREEFFAVRFQVAGQSNRYLCSNQAPIPGGWMHIGINLGMPSAELWVDGIRGTQTKTFMMGAQTATCNNAEGRSIAGNNNPWVFGALGWSSEKDTAATITMPFVNGAIDELTIWRTRRGFAL